MHCFSFWGWVYFKYLVLSSDNLVVIKRLKKPAESDLNSDYVDKIIRPQGDTLPFFSVWLKWAVFWQLTVLVEVRKTKINPNKLWILTSYNNNRKSRCKLTKIYTPPNATDPKIGISISTLWNATHHHHYHEQRSKMCQTVSPAAGDAAWTSYTHQAASCPACLWAHTRSHRDGTKMYDFHICCCFYHNNTFTRPWTATRATTVATVNRGS